MNPAVVLCFICFMVVPHFNDAYNILAIFHFPAKSTMQTFTPFLKRLTESGHNLTFITNYQLEGVESNYREILIDGAEIVRHTKVLTDLSNVPQWRFFAYFGPSIIDRFNKKVCSLLFESEEIQKLIRESKFDLVILQIFQTECVYQLAKQFGCPIIGVHSTVVMSWTANRFALSVNPSYIPSCYMPAATRMSFWSRLENTLIIFLHDLYYKLVMLPTDKEIVKKYYGGYEAEELPSIVYNTSLFLVNTHYSVNPPRPLVPNVIEIGGIHLEPQKSLPQVSELSV